MNVIAVASRKGGAGKTTICAHLAAHAHALGRRTLLIDADPQGSLALCNSLRSSALPFATAERGIERPIALAMVDGVEWVFDVAHNPAAVTVLAASIARLPRPARTLAVFAAMRDKDLAGVVAPFVTSVDAWFVTQANAERGATGEELRDVLAASGARAIEVAPDVAASTAAARAAAQPGERVIVFGSFVTVGAAADALGLYCAPSRMGDRPAKWTRV